MHAHVRTLPTHTHTHTHTHTCTHTHTRHAQATDAAGAAAVEPSGLGPNEPQYDGVVVPLPAAEALAAADNVSVPVLYW
jgi:hypothetical protein